MRTELERTLWWKTVEGLGELQAQAQTAASEITEELASSASASEIVQLPGAEPVPVRRLQTDAGAGATDLDERPLG